MIDLLPLIGAQPNAQGQPSPIGMFLPIIAILFIYYFLLVRPQQKQAQKHKELVGSLKKGDEVVTESGLIGSVISVHDDHIILKAGENVKLKFLKNKVAARTSDTVAERKK